MRDDAGILYRGGKQPSNPPAPPQPQASPPPPPQGSGRSKHEVEVHIKPVVDLEQITDETLDRLADLLWPRIRTRMIKDAQRTGPEGWRP